ncbi:MULTISPECIES: hypothetical protein [unclassified Methylobacterium]|uniref:hypothetical protein n=1 Tax=unclassified Methylobacterium TaxID=2615210 RepID=UPI0037011738
MLAGGALLLAASAGPSEAGAARAGGGSCYLTGGGALEICRSSNEAEGVYAVPPPCRFVHDVQILRLKDTGPPGPLQVIYRAEPPRREGRRGEESCPADLRATDAAAGGAVRIGRQVEALATTLPLADPRFWNEAQAGAGPGTARAAQAASPRRRSRASRQARREARRAEREAGERGKMTFQPQTVAPENDPSGSAMMVAGRDWAGDPYYAILTTATEPAPEGHRRVLVQARTYDFQGLDLRVEADPGTAWKPFGAPPQAEGRRRGRGRPEAQKPAPVLDETGKPIVGHCAAPGLEARGLTGSIAMVDRTYHYFYTDVLPSDCGAAPAKRRMGLYLRTSRDPLAERAWSAPVTLIEGLPADTTMRVAKARGMDRWAVAYTCARPVTASGGPVADICLHYTADLSPGSITALSLYSEPVAAGHSSAYLGLRSGGDALGRFTRDGFGWMTDRYGNLDAPAIYPDKGGFLTWLDRRAPRVDGSDASSLYGRPVFWATWTVQPRPAAP